MSDQPRTTIEVANSIGFRADFVHAILREEVERGNVERVGQGWALTASARREFGDALRSFPLFGTTTVADPRSGVQEDGRWVPAFQGQRPPLPRGHLLSTKHGASAGVGLMRLAPRVNEIADTIRAIMPAYSEADEPVVRLLAVCQARVERAVAVLDRIDEQLGDDPLGAYLGPEPSMKTLQRLREDTRGWVNSSKRLASELGMTPTSRAKLGLDVALTRRALTLVELTEEAAEEEATIIAAYAKR